MTEVTVAAAQMACSWNITANIERAEQLVRRAAAQGAQIVLLQELFETPYFCVDQSASHFRLARPLGDHPVLARFQALARELAVVLPFSFFERANNAHYNSVAMIDADGRVLGCYRKSHIPNGPGYQEKQFFNPGDTGFRVWDTGYGRIGLGICWDQWFPETARCLALLGAELLLFPTAIGSEPQAPGLDSAGHWQRTMQGHAAANMVPLVAANRIGTEYSQDRPDLSLTFYGSSFITDHTGAKVAEADRSEETVLVQRFDLAAIQSARASWGLFRDRRPDCYRPLLTLDGQTPPTGY